MSSKLHKLSTSVERVQARLMHDRQSYAALIGAIKHIADPLEFWSAVRILGPAATQHAALSRHHLENDEAVLSFLAANWPGVLLWNLNKRISDPYQRQSIADLVAARSPAAQLSHVDEVFRSELRGSGVVVLPEVLGQAEIQEMAVFLETRPNLIKEGPVYANTADDIACAPHALRLATHPRILGIVGGFLGTAPIIADLCAWRTDPSPNDDYGAHQFHRDRDDFRACKLFLYLSDVEADDGPHVFVRGSHDPESTKSLLERRQLGAKLLGAKLFDSLFCSDGRAIGNMIPKIFGEAVTQITGNAGKCFLESTYGFHRGRSVRRRSRLLFQVLYAGVMYPHRYERFSSIELEQIPADCLNNESTRRALSAILP
jgi:hypothetical protein